MYFQNANVGNGVSEQSMKNCIKCKICNRLWLHSDFVCCKSLVLVCVCGHRGLSLGQWHGFCEEILIMESLLWYYTCLQWGSIVCALFICCETILFCSLRRGAIVIVAVSVGGGSGGGSDENLRWVLNEFVRRCVW